MTKFLNITESGAITAPVSLNSPELKINGDSVAGLLDQKSEVDHIHVTVSEDILLNQTIEAGIIAPAAIYFDSEADMWKLYTPSLAESEKVPALYTSNNTVALEGAMISMSYGSDYIFIGEDGTLQTKLDTLTMRNVIAHRVGPTQFKVGHSKQDCRLKKFCDKIQNSTSNENDYLGCSVSICDNVAIVGAFGEEVGTDFYGAAFIFRYDGENWIEEQKLVPSDAGQMGYFGYTTSISGDVAIVGAMYASKAFIFRYNGTTWVEEQMLQGSDIGSGDMFSSSVSISGDVAFVGSFKNACYVFKYNGISWVEEQILQSTDIKEGDGFGISVSVSGNVAAVCSIPEATGGTDAGSVYIFRYNSTNWVEEQKIQASDVKNTDRFGYPINISGDAVVVGAHGEDTGGSDAGAVYVFRHNGTTWIEEQKLTASDAQEGDGFGYAVSLSGNTLIVGAYMEDEFGSDAGAAYVYTYDGSIWTEEKKIVSEEIEADDNFGMSVALCGDAAIVGALNENSNGSSSGAAYIFGLNCEAEVELQNDTLIKQKIDTDISSPAAVYYDTTEGMWKKYIPSVVGIKKVPALHIGGGRVALSGAVTELDFDGDILFIDEDGSLKPNLQIVSTRKVLGYRVGQSHFKVDFDEYDFRLKQFCEKIKASDPGEYDYFASSVCIHGDTAIVGSEHTSTGVAYIFRYNGAYWEEETQLRSSDIAGGDSFGYSVSLSDDTAIVGAINDDPGGNSTGSAYIFRYNGTTWEQEAKLWSSSIEVSGQFGRSVSIDGDKAIVGTGQTNNNTGTVYFYQYDGSSWNKVSELQASDAAEWQFFGESVSISGTTALVGAYGTKTGGYSTGAVYVFHFNGITWIEETILRSGDIASGDQFGKSLSLSGDVAIIGAQYEDTGASAAGAAYIFRYNGAAWEEEIKLQSSDAELEDYFGKSVSISGNTAIVGAHCEDTGGTATGAAYLYRYNGITWEEKIKLQANDKEEQDYFGTSVSIHDNVAFVGANYEQTGGNAAGAAYVFDLSNV